MTPAELAKLKERGVREALTDKIGKLIWDATEDARKDGFAKLPKKKRC